MKKRYFMVTAILLIISGFSVFAQGQSEEQIESEWEDPSERYSDAYKQYMDAECPLDEDEIKHYVYFARDRESMQNHPFLDISRFQGAQIMYTWRELEPSKGEYDFTIIDEDIRYLQSKGKKLFLQIQDATFYNRYIAVPKYLLTEEYDGGAVQQRDDNGDPEGWVAKRWNSEVQDRFALFLNALGQEFDGIIEGVNLQESSIGVSTEYDQSFTPQIYADSLKINMLALKKAFPRSVTMQYANFMPGEWLPWDDYGYLRSIYQYGEEIGVGLGGPDLMVQRKGQQNHTIAMMHENEYMVPLGIAIQDGNYIGQTGTYTVSDDDIRNRGNAVPMLHSFAKDFLKVSYMFWSYQEPYFTEDVIPCFLSKE